MLDDHAIEARDGIFIEARRFAIDRAGGIPQSVCDILSNGLMGRMQGGDAGNA